MSDETEMLQRKLEAALGLLALTSMTCSIVINHLGEPFRIKEDLERLRALCKAGVEELAP